MKWLLVAGGDAGSVEFVRKIVKEYSPDRIIAADSGAEHLERAGIRADVLLGDFDSIAKDSFERLKKDSEVISLPSQKDDTDTAAAAELALLNGADDILILGGIGSRFDHSYANVLLLKKCLDSGVRARLINENNEIELFGGSFEIIDSVGKTVSFYALFSDVIITLDGFHYPLEDYCLKMTDPLAVSNVIEDDRASVRFEGGFLLRIIASD